MVFDKAQAQVLRVVHMYLTPLILGYFVWGSRTSSIKKGSPKVDMGCQYTCFWSGVQKQDSSPLHAKHAAA